ncbi:hypothetical protein F5884DRAFT_897410 [Xylogone sp. PMI_703]|nr:hypothetical protein F5884DRAFT_897410 [Xylogone sp. PMI_703]
MSSVLLLFLLLLHQASCATVTLTDLPAYQSQRPCAIDCFYYGFSSKGGPDGIAENIGCNVDPIMNECLCRPDLQAQADAYLSNCVRSKCDQNSLDVNSAVTIYDDYCTSAGYYRVTDAPATSTSGTQASPTTVTVTVMQTVSVSSAERRLRSPLAELVAQVAMMLE